MSKYNFSILQSNTPMPLFQWGKYIYSDNPAYPIVKVFDKDENNQAK